MQENELYAPGWPGTPARWTTSAKSAVGTALTASSRTWFTLSHGIFNEIYYPRLDQACTRDMGLIVTSGQDFFSEEKRHTSHQTFSPVQGVPMFRLVNTCEQERYNIEKEIMADPERDCVLQKTHFEPLMGNLEDYHLYVLLAPHLGNQGAGNTAWVGRHKGVTMLFAERDGLALALACSAPWLKHSVGFVGTSDGWQDLSQHKEMTWAYTRAENGNVALTGEIDLRAAKGNFTLALGFGITPAEAGYRALASLIRTFDSLQPEYVREWEEWQRRLLSLEEAKEEEARDLYRVSAAVLRTHEAKSFTGGIIASLSIPWGDDKGDNDLGGYHLVWPRDLVETAGGLLAAGGKEDVCRVLRYLQVTQEANGHWPQNMWMDGTPYWTAVQMDETALPILLVDLARREGALDEADLQSFWQMVRKAASCIVRYGPVTEEDRWEEDAGYTAFTLGAEIAALLVAADMADSYGEPSVANHMRETADAWNARIEHWIYAANTDIAKEVGVEGYYFRIAPPAAASSAAPSDLEVEIKNRPPGQNFETASQVVSTDALALVRFGLRSANDPRILNTVKVIDSRLKVETPVAPVWHRYNYDGYGEHQDGSSYDGTGIGRVWPLLSGERAHYELAAGRHNNAERLMYNMQAFSNDGGLIPEQVWDSADIPDEGLYCGRPSGSAMPLVWAHAEYVKLRRSLRDGRVFDMPPQTVHRYLVHKTGSRHAIWRFNNKRRTLIAGKTLRVEVTSPAMLHWSADGWQTAQDAEMPDTGLGVYIADLPTSKLQHGSQVVFTFHWTTPDKWEGANYTVLVE